MKATKLGAVSLCAIISALAMPAWAQASSSDSDNSDIIVTARRIEEKLQDVPISITVFNQEQLTNRNIVNAQDIAAYTPSLTAKNQFGTDNTTFAIRGFVQDIGTLPSVGTYFADVVAPRAGQLGYAAGDGAGPGAFFDLQNVQVLKGPQGTLFGRNTTGGAVLLVPKKPTGRLEGYLEGSAGNLSMYRVQGVLNLPLSENIRLRVGVDHQKRDGTIENLAPVGPDRVNDVNYVAVRASLVIDITPDLENYTIGSYTHSRNNGQLTKLIGCRESSTYNPLPQDFALNLFAPSACSNIAVQNQHGFWSAFGAVPNPSSQLDTWQVVNTTTWQASDNLTIKNIISYAEYKQMYRSSYFGIYPTVTPNLAAAYALTPNVPFYFVQISAIPDQPSAHQSTFTEELQFQGNSADGKLTWQAGGYMEKSDPIGINGVQNAATLSCTNAQAFQCTDVLSPLIGGFPFGSFSYSTNGSHYRNYGLYAQASYNLTDSLKVTGGIRYTWDKHSSDAQVRTYRLIGGVPTIFCTDPTTETPAPECKFNGQAASSAKPTWLIGLDYKPSPDILLYAKYTRGYRGGGVKPDAPNGYQSFLPEKVDSYELGLKSSFHGAVSGTFNLAAFYNDFVNQQILFTFSGIPGSGKAGGSSPINAGKSRIYGLEADLNVNLTSWLMLEGHYTYLNARIQRIDVPVSPAGYVPLPTNVVLPGDLLTLSPDHKLVLGATVTLPVDEKIGKISLGANYIHTSSQRSAYNNRNFIQFFNGVDLGILPPTNVFNIYANWNSVGGLPVDLSAFMTNVTNAKFYTFVNGIITSGGFEAATLNEPRMWGFRLRYRFGN
ncbi:MAG: TonB-dependent receptor [Novosphingobium sp.]